MVIPKDALYIGIDGDILILIGGWGTYREGHGALDEYEVVWPWEEGDIDLVKSLGLPIEFIKGE